MKCMTFLRPAIKGLAVLTIAVLAAACVSPAMAQGYPDKSVRILVGQSAGGPTDTLARMIGDKLSQMWGQPVIVINRPGASGSIAMDQVAKSAPDGYTLGMLILNHVVFEQMIRKPPYLIARDLDPVISIARQSNILVLHPSVPATTVPEFIAYLKANPGKISYASGGAGSPAHVSAELFKLQTRVDMVHVPYKGGGAAVPDLLAGIVPIMFAAAPFALPLVRDGKLRALAVTSDSRSAQTPDIPSLAESGIQYDVRDWQGIAGPAGLPAAVVERINADVQTILDSPDMKARISSLGGEVAGGPPSRFADQLRSETRKWKRVVDEAKLVNE
ncbi:MAG: tripartite tricarboxylate transporter substrate binding protein [Lautropia sp.]